MLPQDHNSKAIHEMKPILPKLDISRIASMADSLGNMLINRGDPSGKEKVAALLQANELRKQTRKRVEELQSKRNKGESIDRSLMASEKTRAEQADRDFYQRCLHLPNWIHRDVPVGDESNARLIRQSRTQVSAKQ